jgi:hypothetical protein
MVYESIDLGFISALTPSESSPQPEQRPYDALALSQPIITVDPLDTCVLCIHHALGVHRISCRSWMEELASALLPAEPEGALQSFWKEGHSSDVEFLVDTLRGGGRLACYRRLDPTAMLTLTKSPTGRSHQFLSLDSRSWRISEYLTPCWL